MKNKHFFVQLTGILVIFVLFIQNVSEPLYAQEVSDDFPFENASENTAPETEVQNPQLPVSDQVPEQQNINQTAPQPGATEIFSEQTSKRLEFLRSVEEQLKSAQQDYYSIKNHVTDTEEKLQEIRDHNNTLRDHLKNLDEHIQNTMARLENVVSQINEKEIELTNIAENLKIKKLEIENQKEMLMEYLQLLYSQEKSIFNTSDSSFEEVNIAKLLLSDKAVGEILQELEYFKVLEKNSHALFDRLQTLATEQAVEQKKAESIQQKLTLHYKQLEQEKENLEMQREAKQKLLEETQGQEKIYQQLLEEAKLEQTQTLHDMQAFRDNLAFIKQKMEELGDGFNPESYRNIFDREFVSVYDYINSTQEAGEVLLKWPVTPSRGVSAYFRDEAYRRYFGVGHDAIDIRIPQGTPIRAPADGVVYKTKDAGYGYSYIILAHSGGLMTLYGHVSEIRVQTGEKIAEGQVIGLSGAMPGTKGAGLMTTGPHLHLEVFKGGKHVDPLDYLPLSYLPLESLPAKYLHRVTGEAEKKVKRISEE